MTAEAFSNLPLAAGGAVAAAGGRAVRWVFSLYMQQPLRNTAVSALVVLSAMAGSNALYKQSHHHPAPLFGSFTAAPVVAKKAPVTPVLPANRPKRLELVTDPTPTGSLEPAAQTAPPIGNADVLEIQRKLTAFGFFDGTVDGLFGPRTSRAIKSFETKTGRAPKGQLTPEIIAAIKSTPITATPEAAPAAAVTLDMQPVAAEATPTVKIELPSAPVDAAKPLPAPSPLLKATATPVPTKDVPTATDGATGSTGGPDVIDTIINGVQSMAMTSPNQVVKRAVQTIAVTAKIAESEPVQSMPAPLATVPQDPNAAASPEIVASVQKGLSSLGFLHGEIDGVAGEATAKAVRNFEVYYNYEVTGRITPQLVDLLKQNGAQI